MLAEDDQTDASQLLIPQAANRGAGLHVEPTGALLPPPRSTVWVMTWKHLHSCPEHHKISLQ